jgi:starch-binding outer membrane protein, SusD/RagB family
MDSIHRQELSWQEFRLGFKTKMDKNMKIKLYKTTLLAILLLAACNDSVLDKSNPNGGTPQTYYSTTDELTKGVNAIYAVAQSISLVAREWFFIHDLRSDDMATGGGQLEVPRAQLLNGTNDAANSVALSVWSGFYELIHRSNSVIVGSANAGLNVSDADKKRFVGEARFLRAWAYSDLIVLWGAVPLYTEPVLTLDGGKARTSIDEINTFLIDELTAIQPDLPLTWVNDERGRATRGAAQALLARVYMFKGDYAKAKIELDKIVTEGTYNLVDNYFDNFKEETPFNDESIFEIGYFNDQNNWNGNGDGTGLQEGNTRTQEYSAVGWRNLIPSDALLAEYERTSNGFSENDPRFDDTFVRIGDLITNTNYPLAAGQVQGNTSTFESGQEKISWRKYTSIYKTDATFYTGPMDMRIIRYAEVLLNLAECENELGNGATAIDYLNMVRDRPSVMLDHYPIAGKYPCTTKDEIFDAIVHERRVELAGEQIRNRDLVRWRNQGKLAVDPVSYKKTLVKIPANEIANNQNITEADQN